MPRFFAMLCLQKMRNGMGRPHAALLCNALLQKMRNAMGELTIQQPARRASCFL
jgi:hypothetical protein